jgi:hypothetical protein
MECNVQMKFPKYSCSACGKPATRKWNLARHIDICHAGIGNCISNWGFSAGSYDQVWNKPEKAATHRENVRSEFLRQFLLSRNESIDRKSEPDYQHVLKEEFLKEVARKAASLSGSIIRPAQTAMSFPFFPKIQARYYLDPKSYLQIFGFTAYVCDKCLVSETHYVACADAEGDGRIEEAHVCDPTNVAIATELIGRYGIFRFLQNNFPTLLKQKVNSWTGKNSHLVAVKLPSPPEESIKLHNPANPANPGIVFQYSKQRHIKLQLNNENKNKANYLIRAINQGKIPLHDEELTDFLENIKHATFGIVTICRNNIYKNLSTKQGEVHREPHMSYFVYIRQ